MLSPVHYPVYSLQLWEAGWTSLLLKRWRQWLPVLNPGVSQSKTRNFSTTSRLGHGCAGELGVRAVTHSVSGPLEPALGFIKWFQRVYLESLLTDHMSSFKRAVLYNGW